MLSAIYLFSLTTPLPFRSAAISRIVRGRLRGLRRFPERGHQDRGGFQISSRLSSLSQKIPPTLFWLLIFASSTTKSYFCAAPTWAGRIRIQKTSPLG